MPKDFEDCIKAVIKSGKKQGKDKRDAESLAYGVCTKQYKDKHGKAPKHESFILRILEGVNSINEDEFSIDNLDPESPREKIGQSIDDLSNDFDEWESFQVGDKVMAIEDMYYMGGQDPKMI